ncbi:hypothetical protein PMI35_05502 [Pseudomonas sp. GM78]|nr:hypothetical protein PMI35_05502 [Pseudomonas sp. GM78]
MFISTMSVCKGADSDGLTKTVAVMVSYCLLVCSAIYRASTSMPKYLAVLSSFVWWRDDLSHAAGSETKILTAEMA